MSEPTSVYPAINFDFGATGLPTDFADIVGLLVSTPAITAEIADYLNAKDNLTRNLLKGTIPAPNGTFLVEQLTAQVAADGTGTAFSTITPGGTFPIATAGLTTPVTYTTAKRGGVAHVTREALLATRMNAVDRAVRLLGNRWSNTLDALTVAEINRVIPSTVIGGVPARAVASASLWSAGVAGDVLAAISLACTTIDDARLSSEPQTIVMSNANYSALAGNTALQTLLALSNKDNSSDSKGNKEIEGLTILKVPTPLCVGTAFEHAALVCDTDSLGGLGEQAGLQASTVYCGPEITTSPQTFVVALDHIVTPYVENPFAGCWITGISA